MSIMAKDGGENFAPAPAGTHAAVCTRVIDLGHHYSELYRKTQHKIMLSWEIAETMDDGRPWLVSSWYTLSLGDKANLRKHLESWRGRPFTEEELEGFDLKNLLGKGCLLSVTHKPGTRGMRANVASVSALAKGMTAPDPVGELLLFDISAPNMSVLDRLSDGIRTIIADAEENKITTAKPGAEPLGDDEQVPL